MFDLGIDLNMQGKLTFDPSKIDSSNPDALMDFLGSTSSTGFLKTASDALDLAEDPTSGAVKQAMATLKTDMSHQDDLIATTQKRIDDLTAGLQERMAAADAAIAALQQQASFMTSLFQAMSDNTNNANK